MNAGVVSTTGSLAKVCVRIAVPLALCLLAFDAIAQIWADSADERANNRVRAQLEVAATQTPRFDSVDGATRASRIDMTLLPAGRASIGPAIGVTTNHGPSFNSAGLASTPPSVDLGVHLRYTTDDNNRVDVRAWRRVAQNDAITQLQMREPGYGARVELHIAAAPKSGLIADHGIGMQLESGARITLHRSAGKPMMFYRARF